MEGFYGAVCHMETSNAMCRYFGFVVKSVFVSALLAVGVPMAHASVLDRIAADGVLHAGTRADAAPFATRLEDGRFEGFSVDLLEAIRVAVERRVGRSVRLDLHPVTPSDRFQRIIDGELDIVCGITTPTHEREAVVDFSLPFFRDGTRVLAFRDTVDRGINVARMTIGVAEGTTTERTVKDALPAAVTKTYPDMHAAMAALERGEIEGVANIGVVLMGLSRDIEPRRSVVLLPRTEALGMEAMACVLPENDSAWRDLVNAALIDLYDGIDSFRGPYVKIYDRWFGRDSNMVYPLDRATRDYLHQLDIWAR